MDVTELHWAKPTMGLRSVGWLPPNQGRNWVGFSSEAWNHHGVQHSGQGRKLKGLAVKHA
jgi:hypothetical protein